eukprot:49651-Chlamydomonas_euryale.AAC.1
MDGCAGWMRASVACAGWMCHAWHSFNAQHIRLAHATGAYVTRGIALMHDTSTQHMPRALCHAW